MKITYTLFFFFSFFCIHQIHATVFTSVQTGNWTDPATWDQPGIPSATDDVIIDGYQVNINNSDGDITINSITVTNASNTGDSRLKVTQSATLTITGNLIAIAENIAYDVRVITYLSAVINVNGNAIFTKTADNTQTNLLQLYMRNSSRVNILGNYILNYGNGAAADSDEIFIDTNAILDIQGSTTINNTGLVGTASIYLSNNSQMSTTLGFNANLSGGDNIQVWVTGSTVFQVSGDVSLSNTGGSGMVWMKAGDFGGSGVIAVGGDFNMSSGASGKSVELHADGAASLLDIDGDITMSATSQSDVLINLSSSTTLELGGNIVRPTNFGSINMDNTSTIDFNGTVSQSIPPSNLALSGTDNFSFTNITFDNTSGISIPLNGDVIVNTELVLTNGIIETNSTNLLIIADQATVTGGSETAYIDGPMIKEGRSNGAPFVFPIGDGSLYAPLEISAISSSSSQYTAQAFGDPPPFGNSVSADVGTISEYQYWELSKTPGSEDVDVTLNWMDGAANGITNLDSTIVVGLNESNIWENFGKGGTTGGTGSGISGSVSSTDGDPPPFGVTKFTIGSLPLAIPKIILPSGLNGVNGATELLPVELIRFYAFLQEDKVALRWQTASEINTSHFVVECTMDGHNFREVGTIFSKGESDINQYYSSIDDSPSSGVNCYRLKIVDNDGSYEYSPIVAVNIVKPKALSIYPNPVDKVLHLKGVGSLEDEGILEVFDINGQRIYAGKCVLEDRRRQISINAINVHLPGTYVLRFTTISGSHVLKFNKI